MAPTQRNDALILLSHLLEAALGSLLWRHRIEFAATAASIAAGGAEFIIHQLQWFMTAKPAGIKLHLQLAQFLGLLGIKYINFLQNIVYMLPIMQLIELVVMITAITLPLVGLGTNKKFRIATAQCLFIFTAPISLAYTVMALLYKWHLNATIHTWLAMRGKTPLLPSSLFTHKAMVDGKKAEPGEEKKNKTASASSAARKDLPQPLYPTHLAVASLLFMPCVLTLPTTAWFYAFWSLVELVVYGFPLTSASFIVRSFFSGIDNESEESAVPDILDVLKKWIHGHVFTIDN